MFSHTMLHAGMTEYQPWHFVGTSHDPGHNRHTIADFDQSSNETSESLNTCVGSFGENGEKDANNDRPPFSYVALITMALRSSPTARLTLSEIYDYLIQNFEYFKGRKNRGWMNAVRHNLTLNDCFVKLPRNPLMRGKGCYWCIDPDSKGMFNHGSLKRRRTRYKRSREETDVVRDIMVKECNVSPRPYVPQPEGHITHRSPQPLRRGYVARYAPYVVPMTVSKTKKKNRFSNFSIDAILAKDSPIKKNKSKRVLKWCRTEIWKY